MKTKTVAELADVMFDVHRDCELSNADFTSSLISCAVSIGVRDGLTDEALVKHVVESATTALAAIRTRLALMGEGIDDEEYAALKAAQDRIKHQHAVDNLPADDRRHIESKAALAKLNALVSENLGITGKKH